MEYILPFLSERDPEESNESAIYPLGLNIIADSLATSLIPGVRERQSHPRYLTAVAVSAKVCSDFDEDRIAKDEISEPWQVFEWYMVEGLVRRIPKEQRANMGRLPGIDKVDKAVNKDKVPLSAKRYLVMPSVFGFHGVYRVLAKELDIVVDGRLSENGFRLLNTWEKEQGLKGFMDNQGGLGSDMRRQLYSAIDDGLQKASTDRSGGWQGWDFFAQHLHPKQAGKHENDVLKEFLITSQSNLRKQVVEFLVTDEGQKTWKKSESERQFHEKLLKSADEGLKALLSAILEYEKFARLMQDAFDDIMFILSHKKGRLKVSELAKGIKEENVVELINDSYRKNMRLLDVVDFNERLRFEKIFGDFSSKMNKEDIAALLISHHIKTQKNKPPNGRAPWMERYDDKSYAVRAAYTRDKAGKHNGEYVHFYRTSSLQSFAEDLGWVKKNG